MPAAHRRWILINAVIGSAVSNLFVNGAIAWVTSKGKVDIHLWSVPLFGGPNLLTDTLGTLFLLPFSTCIVVTLAVRQAKGRGRLTTLESHQRGPKWVTDLPDSIVRRAVRLGLVTLRLGGPLAAVILIVWFSNGISRNDFVTFKTILGLSLGLVVTPFIALAAMGDDHGDDHAEATLVSAGPGSPRSAP